MARLRRAAPKVADGIPPALADPAAMEWHDGELFEALVDELALDIRDPWPACYPAAACTRRRAEAVRRWALLNGYVSTKWPGTPDHDRLRLAGLDKLQTRTTCPHQ